MDKILKDYLYSSDFMDHFGNSCSKDQGPHVLCKIIIYFFILSLFLSIIKFIIGVVEFIKLPKNHIVNKIYITQFVSQIIMILLNIFWIYFIYNLCFLCRGWTAFFLYLLYSLIVGGLFIYFFKKVSVSNIRNRHMVNRQ